MKTVSNMAFAVGHVKGLFLLQQGKTIAHQSYPA
jgi:hypothetical protein